MVIKEKECLRLSKISSSKTGTPSAKHEHEGSPLLAELSPKSNSLQRQALLVHAQETTHLQWKKQLLNFFVFFCLTLVNLFRGSKKAPSIINMKRCSPADWCSLFAFCLICICVIAYALKIFKREQWLKENHGRGLCSTDIKVSGNSLVTLLVNSFFGGLVSGALGLGGGSIFNPLLLSLGCPPTVASCTGMYMVIFSTMTSTITYTIAGTI